MNEPEQTQQDGDDHSTARILPLGVAVPMPSPAEADRIAEQNGMTKVTWNTVRDMQRLGVELESMGVVTTNIGYGMATIDSLKKALAVMEAKMADPLTKNPKLYVGPMVNLGKAIAALIATTSRIRERSSLPDNAEPKQNRSFGAGAVIDVPVRKARQP